MRGDTERKKVKAAVDQNSSNPYAAYMASRSRSSSSSNSSPKRAVSRASTTPSITPDLIVDSKDKNKNTPQEARVFDLVTARKDLDLCTTPQEISQLKAWLQPIIISRLQKLSEMEQIPEVGKEIADAVDFLQSLNPKDPIFDEIGNISQSSRKGVTNLEDGVKELKKAQEKLISQLRSLTPNDHKEL